MEVLVSIIIPVYNVEEYLPACIDSVLNQSLNNIEIILVNDGSTDNSGKICDEYAIKDNRIKVIHRKYSGVSTARNIGIKAASGKYIGFVDSDDYIQKDMYEKLYNLCIEHDCEIAVCKLGREIDGNLININKNENELIKVMDNMESMKQLFIGNLYRFSLCNKLFKKSCFRDVEFPEGRIHEDLSTTYKLFANSNKCVYTNYIGYVYVKRNNSILTKKFYEKRLDAFIGWDEIQEYMTKEYPELINEVTACFTYSCVDNIYYILNQVDSRQDIKNYLRKIKLYTKKYNKNIMSNKILTKRYKYIVKIFNLSEELFFTLDKLKNNLCKRKL